MVGDNLLTLENELRVTEAFKLYFKCNIIMPNIHLALKSADPKSKSVMVGRSAKIETIKFI